MKSARFLTTAVLQLVLVVFVNVVASYVFIRSIEIIYSPLQTTLQLLFMLAIAIGILVGTVTVFKLKSPGSGFFIFLLILLLPAILTESRVSIFLIMQARKGFLRYEVYMLSIAVVGGYFYLRHVALSNRTRSQLLIKGGSEESLTQAAKWGGYITGLTVLGTIAIVLLLTVGVPILANALQPNPVMWLPIYIFIFLGTVLGIVVVIMVHSYQRLIGEQLQVPTNQKKAQKRDFEGKDEERNQLSTTEEKLREFIERGKP